MTRIEGKTFDQLGGMDTFLTLNNTQRISLLSKFTPQTSPECAPNQLSTAETLLNKKIGILVIKPEALVGKDLVINFLQKKYGIEPLATKDFTYLLEGYLSIYFKTIKTYPDSFTDILAPLLFLNTTQASSAIVFQHQQDYKGEYQKLFDKNPQEWLSSPDSDHISDFKRIVVGSGFEPAPHTIRRELEPLIENDGYYTFTKGVAQEINIESRLQLRPLSSNRITFNGVHSPESGQALTTCFNTIFEAKEIEDIISRVVS